MAPCSAAVCMTRVVNLRGSNPGETTRIDRLTKYGNPFKVGVHGDRGTCLGLYRTYIRWVLANIDSDFLEPLRGRVLGCWCKPLPCHGDVIVELLDRRPA